MTKAPTLDRISDYPAHHADTEPDRVALRAKGAQLTYSELVVEVDRYAAGLLAAGVQPRQRVAVLGVPDIDVVVSYLATASIGAVWLGLNPRYSAPELGYVLSDAQPVLVAHVLPPEEQDAVGHLDTAVTKALPGAQVLDGRTSVLASGCEPDRAALDAVRARVRTQDPALVVYTSGSTGAPKGALIRHSGLVRLGVVESSVWGLETPTMVCNLPVNHIGSIGDLVGVPLVAGGTLLLRPRFDAEELLQDLQDEGVNALFQIPTQLQRVAALPGFADANLSALQLVGWGGSPLPLSAITAYREKGCALIATYGLTEATSSVTYTDPDAPDEVLLHTVGRPDPGMQVRLLGADGTWVAGDEVGEVCVKNPTTMAGYLNRPEATAEAHTADGWLRTGDIGRLREDGNLVLVGRSTEMFKSGGYNIYPREIELVLEDHPAVQSVAVVPRPDEDFHEVGAAYVQLHSGAEASEEDLRSFARERLANFKVPKTFTILSELPLLPVGKVDKTALRAAASAPHPPRRNS